MVNVTDVSKKTGKVALTTTTLMSIVAKEGISLIYGVSKCFLGGAENLANQMEGDGLKFGCGKFLQDKTEKLADWSSNKIIEAQKYVRGMIS